MRVIIIGSGLSGLIAGNLLVRKGYDVTIFESHSAPGGYTAGFWRKGFYFESGTLSFEDSASINKMMSDIGLDGKVEFIKQRTRFISDYFDAVPESNTELKEMFLSAFPLEKKGLNSFFRVTDRMVRFLDTFNKPMPALYSGGEEKLRKLKFILSRLPSLFFFKKYQSLTVKEFTAQYFDKESDIFNILTGLGYPDMCSFLYGGVFGTILSDYQTVKTGMQSWADILAENFTKNGGRLNLNSYVERIDTRFGIVNGVTRNGKSFIADFVLSCSDYKKTILKLLDDKIPFRPHEIKALERANVSESFFTVYLGLDLNVEELQKIMKVPHVLLLGKNLSRNFFDASDRDFFRDSTVTLYSPSLINPKLSPEGRSSLMLQAMSPHKWMDNWVPATGRDILN
ncbi:MAG TPA: NAD(P)/FAD-dependent oxidoreductase [Firmicutes bacterium]|nr:NAD(P)/FAD-dependent oxidoreductase [Bacillota bacterium]